MLILNNLEFNSIINHIVFSILLGLKLRTVKVPFFFFFEHYKEGTSVLNQ